MATKKTKTKSKPLPRYWKKTIARLTGLTFCDRDCCRCGENNQLWWKHVPGGEGHDEMELPGWMNGVDTQDVWDWLVENGKV